MFVKIPCQNGHKWINASRIEEAEMRGTTLLIRLVGRTDRVDVTGDEASRLEQWLESVGRPVRVWKYQLGNKASLEAVRAAAASHVHYGRNTLLPCKAGVGLEIYQDDVAPLEGEAAMASLGSQEPAPSVHDGHDSETPVEAPAVAQDAPAPEPAGGERKATLRRQQEPAAMAGSCRLRI